MQAALRAARDADSPRIVEIIGACFARYPGCVFDVEGEMPELNRVASHYAAQRGEIWVAQQDGLCLGCVAWKPLPAGAWELQRLYVDPDRQGRGLGRRLAEHAIASARLKGVAAIELWTDTRFAAAHRLYESLGFTRAAMPRTLNDKSHSVEFFYRLALAGEGNKASPKREF